MTFVPVASQGLRPTSSQSAPSVLRDSSTLMAGTQTSAGIVAVAGVAAICAAASIIRHAKNRDSKREARIRADVRKLREPESLLTDRELRLKKTKAQLMLRNDKVNANFPIFCNPLDERYQLTVRETREMFENPDFESVERLRESMGIPNPPFTWTQWAEEQMKKKDSQGGRSSALATAAPDIPEIERGAKPTMGDLVKNYVAFKGYKQAKARVKAGTPGGAEQTAHEQA
eukprot:CAMPEP_0178460904 /NCGR_PEP_ID=MMETSP0689_2-20121128/48990_1 /TAXON_ID=160604 /ORGANISM="Amphidinium massartii, Strain CS-259" /LENGTH=229 /DNA_ID=CAMNT_0020087635 /DNA_START=67 /DNA_END=754 /DNA_ORIENTATION=+